MVKKLLLIFGIFLMLILSGCIEKTEEKQEISKEKIENAMKNVKSYTIYGKATTIGILPVSISMTVKVDLKNKSKYISIETIGKRIETYIIGNIQYSKTNGVWKKQNVDEFNWNSFAQEISCWKDVKLIQEEKIDNVSCYKLDVDIDVECWKNKNKEMFGKEMESLKIVEVKNFTYYIEKNTYLIKRENFKIKIEEENLGNINMEIDMKFSDYNKTFIELPGEAKG